MSKHCYTLNSLDDTQRLAHLLAEKIASYQLEKRLAQGAILFLSGKLGAGKTAFCRFFIQHLCGSDMVVKSPTYEIVNSYQCHTMPLTIHHADFYRINNADELEYFAFQDSLNNDTIVLVEWWQHAQSALPNPVLTIEMQHNTLDHSVIITPADDLPYDFFITTCF